MGCKHVMYFVCGIAGGRWHAPKIEYPRQEKFFCSKEEFHEEHGLSLEGESPRQVSNINNVTKGMWLSVFEEPQRDILKVHCKTLKPEYYEAFMLVHHKVYQEPPINYNVSIAFAQAFVLEKF